MSSTLGLTWRLIRREIAIHRLRSLLTILLVAAPVALATHVAVISIGTVLTGEETIDRHLGDRDGHVVVMDTGVAEPDGSYAPVACPQHISLSSFEVGCADGSESRKVTPPPLDTLLPAGVTVIGQRPSAAVTAGDGFELTSEVPLDAALAEKLNAHGYGLISRDVARATLPQTVEQAMAWEDWQMAVGLTVPGLALVAALVAAAFAISVKEQETLADVLAVTGAGRRMLFGVVVGHALLLGLGGAGVGTAAGLGTGWLIGLGEAKQMIPWVPILGYAAVAWLVAAVASVIPALRTVLRRRDAQDGSQPRAFPLWALVFGTVGLLAALGFVVLARMPALSGGGSAEPTPDWSPWLLPLALLIALAASVLALPRLLLGVLTLASRRGSAWWRNGLRELVRTSARTVAVITAMVCTVGAGEVLRMGGLWSLVSQPGATATSGDEPAWFRMGLWSALTLTVVALTSVMLLVSTREHRCILQAAGMGPGDATRTAVVIAAAPGTLTQFVVGILVLLPMLALRTQADGFSVGLNLASLFAATVMPLVVAALAALIAVTFTTVERRRVPEPDSSNPSPHPERTLVS